MSGDDWAADPEAQAYLDHVRDEVVPKLTESALTISIVPEGEPDIKFAVELGLSIMFDKPIILVVQPGQEIPAALERVAVAIVRGDPGDPDAQAELMNALRRFGVVK